MSLTVVPLHKNSEYLQDCTNLLNKEWKRSDTARLHSLQSSSDELPTSLILLKDRKLIGHVKLSAIPSIKTACFVESVIIDENLRGKGYGTFLMKKAEEHAQHFLYLDTIYLSTIKEEGFYEKLGYIVCAPISIYGSSVPKTNTQRIEKVTNYVSAGVPPPPPVPLFNKAPTITPSKTYMKKDLQ